MIVNDFPLPAKPVRIDSYNFRLMLVLVIPNFGVFFSFRFLIVPEMLPGLFADKLSSCRSHKIQELLGQCPGRS